MRHGARRPRGDRPDPAAKPGDDGRVRPNRDEAGLSLVELLVAGLLTSIVLAAVATVFVGSLQVVRVVTVKTSTSADARIALEAVTRTIRVATKPSGESSAVTVAKGDAVSFYALINRTTGTAQPLPALVEYSYDGLCVNEATTPGRALTNPPAAGPYYAWDTGRRVKCLVRTSVAPQFVYYATGAISLAGADVTPITVPASGLVLTDRVMVTSIQVTVTAKDRSNPDIGGMPVMDRVTLNNLVM